MGIFHDILEMPVEALTRGQLTLKWFQVILYISSFVFSLFVCVPSAVTTKDFSGKCLLYTTPVVSTKMSNGSMLSVPTILQWADTKTCTYVTYTNILTCIYSLVWCGIFLLVSAADDSDKRMLLDSDRNGLFPLATRIPKSEPRNAILVETHLKSEKVVFPGLLFNTVLFTFELIGSCVLTLGLREWCSSIESAGSEGRYTCESAQRLSTWGVLSPDGINGSRYYILLTIAEVSSWLCTLTTGTLSIISAERFCRTIWSPSFRYTIRYENGLVGMDMRTCRETTPRYKAIDNQTESNQAATPRDFPQESVESHPVDIEPATSTLRRNSSLTNALANAPKRDSNPWGANNEHQPLRMGTNEHQPIRKKYIVVYSQPPGVNDPEDMQLISTV